MGSDLERRSMSLRFLQDKWSSTRVDGTLLTGNDWGGG